MKAKAILFLVCLLALVSLTNCSGAGKADELGSNAGEQEGWHGPPENPSASPKEYFYVKYTGRASQKALKKKNGALMENTCRDSAELNAKGDMIPKLVYETLSGISYYEGESVDKAVFMEFAEYNSKIKTRSCEPITKANPNIPNSEWKECRCLMYVKVDGGQDAVLDKRDKLAE